jgi:hypothetical protein
VNDQETPNQVEFTALGTEARQYAAEERTVRYSFALAAASRSASAFL